MDSEMHQECKAPPERQIFSHSFSLHLFFFSSCQVSTGMFQSSSAYLKRLESEANSALARTSADIKGITYLVSLLLQVVLFWLFFFFKKRKAQTEETCPLLTKVLLLMLEREGRHYPKKK